MPHRVLFMISSMRGGGSEQQTLLLLRHLDRSRLTPHLYVTNRTGELMGRVPEDVSVHSFDEGDRKRGLYFPGRMIRRQVRHLREVLVGGRIDVIYDRTFHMTMIAGPAGHVAGVPRVSTIVSPPEHAVPLVESRFVALKRRRLAKAYRQSHAVVAVSRQAARCAERYYWLPDGAIQVIANPVDVEAVCQSAGMIASRPGQGLILVCVGRMTREKGHRDLLSAVMQTSSRWPADWPGLRLWLIGDGPLRSELESLAAAVERPHIIEFLGTKSSPASFIAAADALVLPSHFEGMPNVVLEAMALGTPVIATRAGGTTELQREEPTILWAEPHRPDSLADAILQFAENRHLAERRAAAASAMVAEHHDVHRTTRRIESLLLDAVSSKC